MENYGDLHDPDVRKIRGQEGSYPLCTKLLYCEKEDSSTTESSQRKRVSFLFNFRGSQVWLHGETF